MGGIAGIDLARNKKIELLNKRNNELLKTKEFIFFKDRLINKKLSSQVALNMIRNHLLND